MLLITDRLEYSELLKQNLLDQGVITSKSIDDLEEAQVNTFHILIIDVDIRSGGSKNIVSRVCDEARRAAIPIVFLARNRDPQGIITANRWGVSAIVSAHDSCHVLRNTILQLIEERPHSRTRAHISIATAALEELTENARSGDAISSTAAEAGVEAIGCAVDGANITTWLDIVWEHDDLTFQHSLLVAGLASAFCRKLGFAEADRKVITCAALLHDLGKARIPYSLLNKPGELSPDERATMRMHPNWGYSMLHGRDEFPEIVSQVALSHHECLDGSGYPHGLRGEQISDAVRIVTICDVFSALIERRSYKKPMDPIKAYRILKEMKGKIDFALLREFGKVLGTSCGCRG